MIKKCPKCGVEGFVPVVFGYRWHREKLQPQGYCRGCRLKNKTPHERLKWLYKVVFPNDKCTSRSTNFILERVKKNGIARTHKK